MCLVEMYLGVLPPVTRQLQYVISPVWALSLPVVASFLFDASRLVVRSVLGVPAFPDLLTRAGGDRQGRSRGLQMSLVLDMPA